MSLEFEERMMVSLCVLKDVQERQSHERLARLRDSQNQWQDRRIARWSGLVREAGPVEMTSSSRRVIYAEDGDGVIEAKK